MFELRIEHIDRIYITEKDRICSYISLRHNDGVNRILNFKDLVLLDAIAKSKGLSVMTFPDLHKVNLSNIIKGIVK